MRLSSAGDPMIYRSRYLDRMLFSPLGYRHDARPPHAKRTRSPTQSRAQVQPQAQPCSEQPLSSGYPQLGYPQPGYPQPSYQQPLAQPTYQQTGHLGERASYLSSRELRLIVGRCEETIKGGRAQIEDYEAFVICQQELSSRA